MALPSCGNRMSSHRIHTYCVYSPTDFHSSGGILPPPQQRVSHRIRRSHRSLCWEYSPTDFTDLHRWLGCVDSSGGILASAAAKCLPQIAQIYTDGLSAKDPPTDWTEFTEPSAGDDLPQIAQISQKSLLRIFSHWFHRFTQMVRVRR